MTHTTTPTDPPTALRPPEILMNLIAALLAPMFLGVTGGDIALARMAAIETVSAYRAGSLLDLIAVAQIVGYGLAALGSLSLSMDDDLSLSMILRLRGNANACSRSAEQNRRAIGKTPGNAEAPHHEPIAAEPETRPTNAEPAPQTTTEHFIDDTAAQILAEESLARLRRPAERAPAATSTPTEKRQQEMWAIAMVKESSEIAAGIPGLPPAERGAASIRAGMLSGTANRLLTGTPLTPQDPVPPLPAPTGSSPDRPPRHPPAT